MEQALYWRQVYTEILAMEEKVLARIQQLMETQSDVARREVELTTCPSWSRRPSASGSALATGMSGSRASKPTEAEVVAGAPALLLAQLADEPDHRLDAAVIVVDRKVLVG